MRNTRENILETRLHSSKLEVKEKSGVENAGIVTRGKSESVDRQPVDRLAETPRKRRESLVEIDLL